MAHNFTRLTTADTQAFIDLDIEMFGADAWPPMMISSYLDSDRVYAIGLRGEEGLDAAAMLGQGIEAEILTISVRPHLRRQGIGSAMLTALCERAKATGAEKIFLEVRASDTGAQALYAQAGFVQAGIRPRYYHDDDAIIMVAE